MRNPFRMSVALYDSVKPKDKPPEPNVYQYSVRIEQMPNEAVRENNVQEFRVSVRDDKSSKQTAAKH